MRDKHFMVNVRRVLQVGGLAGPAGAAGGVWSVASIQTEALRCSGLEVVLLGTWLGSVPSSARSEGQDVVMRVRRPFPGAGLRGLYSFSYLARVNTEARLVDVAHIHLCRDFITVLSTLIVARRGVPIIVQTHGMLTEPKNALVRLYDAVITRRLIRIPRLWLALTAQEERSLKSMGVRGDRIARVVNAAPEGGFRWEDPRDFKFAFIARLAERKQPGVFVEAALRLLESGVDASFVIAGPDQGELERLLEVIRDSGKSDRFEILGHVDQNEVRRILAGATAFVLPARHEPYPMAVIEAASVGTPIILTKECGLATVIGSADAGILIDPDANAVFEAMQRILDSADFRSRLSDNALALHRDIWSVESLAESLMEKYERSANGN